MSGLGGHLVGVMIVVLMVTFIGIWIWAWRPKHRRTFDELATLPMRDGEATDEDTPGVDEEVDARRADGGAAS